MAYNKHGQKWSDEDTILAFYHYCQIPFGRIHKTNPQIIQLAEILGRTPDSVVYKMGNLGHFDPELQKRNVSGLSHASKTDAKIVQRFYDNWEELTFQAKEIQERLMKPAEAVFEAGSVFPIGATQEQLVRQRVNQQFFRNAVLSSYKQCCCITGIGIPTLLIASHIKPWANSDPSERTNPSNGLCLNALHDRAFDKGLITVLPDYTARVSSTLKHVVNAKSVSWLMQCDRQQICLPEKFIPDREFLEYHNDVVFIP